MWEEQAASWQDEEPLDKLGNSAVPHLTVIRPGKVNITDIINITFELWIPSQKNMLLNKQVAK